MGHLMDELDQKLLAALQDGFPLDARPYARLAERIGLDAGDEQAVFDRVMGLVDDGTIRRLGASFDSRSLGYEPTLVALRLPDERVAEVAELVNRYGEVTHNYQRRGQWNLWFTVIARSSGRQGEILAEIRREARLDETDMMNLPVERLLKIDVRFPTR